MDSVQQLIALAQAGDAEAKTRLVESNMGLVRSIVRRFRGRGTEEEDLLQIGSMGLLKAIDKFDLAYDVKFSTYAVPVITGEIKRFLRDDGMIKVSRSLKETAGRARLARDSLWKQTGAEPTLEQVAGELGISPEDLVEALDAVEQVDSLQKIVYEGEGHEISVLDRLEDDDDPQERLLDRMVLSELLSTLKEQEKDLICLRYFRDRTQKDVAKMLGISQVQVSRLEKKILRKLRDRL